MRREPFDGSLDPAETALTSGERQALAVLEEGLASGAGMLLLTGEPGLGKTTLSRVLAVRAEREGVRPVFVHHPRLGFDDLVKLISADLKLPERRGAAAFERLQGLQGALVRGLEHGRRVLVVLDEAQEVPDDTLENLRLLATLEAGPYARPLQVLLVGQPELEARLRRKRWRALAQRIGARAVLAPLSPVEARAFLDRRVAEAGPAVPQEVFSAGAVDAAVRAAGGVPRRLERLGRAALESGSARAERPVRAATVRRAARRIDPRERGGGVPAWAPAVAACGVCAALLVFAVGARDRDHDVRLARAERRLTEARQLLAARDAGRDAGRDVRRDATAAPPPLRVGQTGELRAAAAVDARPADDVAPPAALRPSLR